MNMPYIVPERRAVFEGEIRSILKKIGNGEGEDTRDDKAKGELNYIIFSLVAGHLLENGKMRYHRAQDFITGTLGACEHELLRRLVDTYEDKCIEKNGDLDVLWVD